MPDVLIVMVEPRQIVRLVAAFALGYFITRWIMEGR